MSTVRLLLYYGAMPGRGSAGDQVGLRRGLAEIYARMSPRRRRQLFVVLLLMLLGAVAEIATIGAVMPFLALLANSASAGRHAWIFSIPALPGGSDPVLVAGMVFFLFAVVAGLVRLTLARSSRSFIFRLGHELSVEIQRRVLLQPFIFHTHRNTSTLVTALSKTETLVIDVLLPLMHAVTGGVIALCVIVILLFVAPLTTFTVAAAFVGTYAVISAATRRRLAENSEVLETAYDARQQVVQESLGGIRDVIIDNSQRLYLREFESVDSELTAARTTNQFIGIAPRYVIEMVGMVVIAAIALIAARREGIAAALPILGALALGAQRLLPLVQEVYSGWSALEGQRSIFGQIIELLCLPVNESAEEPSAPLPLGRGISLERVSFTYPTRRGPALDQVSIAIPRGTMVALTGPTGSGKSTLLDVMMGLLAPDTGPVLIDDVALTAATERRWHSSIGHVPQSIYLADSTIARNIALSLPDSPLDQVRIVEAAKKAQLHEFIMSLPEGYDTSVGERGVRLSGGQRQRLGIARAIYKDSPILVLDEATSALDDIMEAAVMGALAELKREGRTIIIVAHRLSTIRHCDLVARLDHGRLVEFGPVGEIADAQAKLS